MKISNDLLIIFRVENKDDSVGFPRDCWPAALELRVPAGVPQLDVGLQVPATHIDVLRNISLEV
jgi:hypothetical protein